MTAADGPTFGAKDEGKRMIRFALTATVALSFSSLPAQAEWSFSGGSSPNAFNQGNNMTLELQCDRIRFSPAGYEDSQDIVSKQGLSIRFMRDGATEAGAFQVGSSNAQISLVDDYPVELLFFESSDYDFVLDQLARNASVDLSMIDRDVTYGIFDLKGSGAAIKSLRAVCSGSGQQATTPIEAPEGVVYCGGGAVQRVIEYATVGQSGDQWDAIVTINGDTVRAMTSYSYFGNSQPPAGFQVALLGEDRSEYLVFSDGARNWIEFGDYTYNQCN